MSILRVGSTGKYSDGWDLAFGKKSSKQVTVPAKKAKERKAEKVKKNTKRASKKKAAPRRGAART
jgi:hypothetical protein